MFNDVESKIKAIYNKKYYEVFHLGKVFTVELVRKILIESLIVEKLSQKESTLQQIKDELIFADNSIPALRWLMEFACEEELINKEFFNEEWRYSLKGEFLKRDLQLLANNILDLDPGWKTFIQLMRIVADDYPLFFKGKKTGIEILFAKDRAHYWDAYFGNVYSAYTAYNEFGALLASEVIALKEHPLILEIGAGTGGATEKLLDLLKKRDLLSRMSQYIYSDISPLFLRTGNKVLMRYLGPDMDYDLFKVDFNKSFTNQKIKEESVDVVYGVNALHVSKNLLQTLNSIKEILKPEGYLVVCEVIRSQKNKPLFLELIFNILDSYTQVDIDPDYRFSHGFLTFEEWKRALEIAGYAKVEIYDNVCGNSQEKQEIIAGVIVGQK